MKPICKLCLINEADKTGSHIVPHFLLKRIDNEDGSTARDKELGFVLSEIYPSSYFGRSTSPEKLEEVYGELTDELIEEKSKLPLVEDNILCKDCEEKLSVIESEYSRTLDLQGEENTNYTSTNTPFLGFLFWSSIIWRLSIATNSGFKLIQRDENQLRNILNKYLDKDIKKVSPNPNHDLLKRIGYKVMRSVNYSKNNSTILFCHPNYTRPYFFVIDEFALIFYLKKQDLKRNHKHFPSIPPEIINGMYNTPHSCRVYI